MAGFFGLFNFEKEGPGIAKDAPKKKTFIVFFETYFRNFWKFITINLVYTLLNIFVITTGFTSAGYTHVARNTALDKHSFGLSDFFETIKKNWKQALAAGFINTVATVILIVDIIFFWGQNTTVGTIGLGISFFLAFIFLIMNFYIWTLMITFKYKLSQIYRNSFRFVFINLKRNLFCGIILLLVYGIFIAITLVFSRFAVVPALMLILSVCCIPGFRFLLIQYCTFPAIRKYIIDPYYEEHPDDDIELRRSLGLDIPSDEDEDEDEDSDEENDLEDDGKSPVFED